MSQHYDVVVIGGGIVGCSVAYHLTKYGIKNVALIERSELAAGSSWHAAGSLFALTHSSFAQILQRYAQDLYRDLEKQLGHSLGLHITGGLTFASSPEELISLKIACATGIRNGIECAIISPKEALDRSPVLSVKGLIAALYEPTRGNVDPTSATQAFADVAKANGASIMLRNRVLQTIQKADGSWNVVTEAGSFGAARIINAAGLWAREVAALAGITLPLMPVEHHYVVTESVPEIAGLTHRLPTMSDNEAEFYSRQEGNGMLVGAYEKDCRHWSKDGTSFDFKQELLPNDLDRILPNLERAFQRIPCLGKVGLRAIVNGPMIFSPDLNPLVGPDRSVKNYYHACGVMTGFNQAAGVGKLLAEWLTEGETSLDVRNWDVARYGGWAVGSFTEERTRYFYEHRHSRLYPDQEFEVGRPVKTVPIHNELANRGAVFGFSFGYEYPLWYARQGEARKDIHSYKRTNWHEAVGRECVAVTQNVGIFEISTFAKFEVSGPSAQDRLDQLLANRMPVAVGRTVLAPMLNHHGKLIGDFTVSKLDRDRFLLLGAGSMQEINMRWFRENLIGAGVEVNNISLKFCGLHVAGPKSRIVLEKTFDVDFSNGGFPFLSCRVLNFFGYDVFAIRVSFTGELGYELYCANEIQAKLFSKLMSFEVEDGVSLVGSRAMMSMRLEKGFPSWGSDLGADYTAAEAGVSHFVKADKDFIGKKATLASGPATIRRVLLSVNANDVDAHGSEPIFLNGKPIGYTTSGGYGHRVKMSLAMGYINSNVSSDLESIELEIAGARYSGRVHLAPLYDPAGTRMRS